MLCCAPERTRRCARNTARTDACPSVDASIGDAWVRGRSDKRRRASAVVAKGDSGLQSPHARKRGEKRGSAVLPKNMKIKASPTD